MVKRPSWSAGSCREALPKGLVWSEGAFGGLGVVRRPSQKAGSSREALSDGQEALPESL